MTFFNARKHVHFDFLTESRPIKRFNFSVKGYMTLDESNV